MIQTTSDGVSFGGRLVVSGRVSISEGVILAAYGGSIEIGAGSVVTKAIDACEIAYGVPAVAVRTRRDQRR
jgi:acetyltransferase-like isoleucine patch superfamily enzyme